MTMEHRPGRRDTLTWKARNRRVYEYGSLLEVVSGASGLAGGVSSRSTQQAALKVKEQSPRSLCGP